MALILAATPARAACVFGKVAELQVTMAGTKPLVNARFNGHDIRMVADSGAFYSMISRADAQALDLVIQPAPQNFFPGRRRGCGGCPN